VTYLLPEADLLAGLIHLFSLLPGLQLLFLYSVFCLSQPAAGLSDLFVV
jgi:hypothetical protein